MNMTVKELIEALKEFPGEWEVRAQTGHGDSEEITWVSRDFPHEKVRIESDLN
jgi:hypothetical protein